MTDERLDAIKFAVAVIFLIAMTAVLLVGSPDQLCDSCPPGSQGRLVHDLFGPACICEVSR